MKSKELVKLKRKLPRGYRKELERRTKSSLRAIDDVLRGVYTNTNIIDAAIKLAEEHQNELKNYSEKIKTL